MNQYGEPRHVLYDYFGGRIFSGGKLVAACCPKDELKADDLAERIVRCVNILANVPDGILEQLEPKTYLLQFDTIEEAEKLLELFRNHEEE